MKCFFHEALMFFKYSAKICVIDNTNLAVLHGTGSNAVFKPDGVNTNPYQPNNRKKPSREEEKRFRDIGSICCDYVDFIKSDGCNVAQKPRLIRELYKLSKK